MKHKLFYTLALIVLTMIGFSTSPADAATANGPYYANPSWDQTLPSNTRFIVLSNMGSAAVLDRETGLVWEKSPDATTHSWGVARFECTRRVVGGRQAWRLPSVHELASLVDPNAGGAPFLPAGHPFQNVQSSAYWSTTTDALNTSFAWVVNFFNGFLSNVDKSDDNFVWCVRGGMNADQY